ncbi:MFS transporter [Granulicoccus phenolivorans]|uniref:MFS transporter n=1 Tax=Granulicoccus phenolivorans TaxID=266854 RepID=UPI000425191F|nr:MFS transporter [Granulicoccus phenolivorans]
MTSTADRASTERFPWLVILVLASAGFLALAVELSPAGLLTRMAPDLNVSVATAGSLTALYALGNAVLTLPLTALVVRFSRRVALAGTLLVFVAGNAAVFLASDLVPALVGRFISGGAHGLLMSLAPAVAIGVAGLKHERLALSIVIGANTVGIALGAPLASVVGTALGWRVTFFAAAVLALVCALLLAVKIPPLRAERTRQMGLLRTIRQPGVLRIGAGWMLMMLAYMAVITYLDPYLADLGAPPLLTSLSLFVFGTGGVVGVWLGGQIAARSRLAALIAMPLLMAASLLLMSLGIRSIPVVLVLLFGWGVGFSGLVMVWQQALLLVGFRSPEQSMGIGVVLSQAGMAAGSALGGLVLSHAGVAATPLVGAIVTVAGLALLIGIRPVLTAAETERAAEAYESTPETSTETV